MSLVHDKANQFVTSIDFKICYYQLTEVCAKDLSAPSTDFAEMSIADSKIGRHVQNN